MTLGRGGGFNVQNLLWRLGPCNLTNLTVVNIGKDSTGLVVCGWRILYEIFGKMIYVIFWLPEYGWVDGRT